MLTTSFSTTQTTQTPLPPRPRLQGPTQTPPYPNQSQVRAFSRMSLGVSIFVSGKGCCGGDNPRESCRRTWGHPNASGSSAVNRGAPQHFDDALGSPDQGLFAEVGRVGLLGRLGLRQVRGCRRCWHLLVLGLRARSLHRCRCRRHGRDVGCGNGLSGGPRNSGHARCETPRNITTTTRRHPSHTCIGSTRGRFLPPA